MKRILGLPSVSCGCVTVIATWTAFTVAGSSLVKAAGAVEPQRPQAVAAPSPQRALLDKYCVTCHNNRLKTGGLTVESLDLRHPAAGGDVALETWEKVVRKVRVGMMPPPGMPSPSDAERSALVG